MSKKFIPNGDSDFSDMAWPIAQAVLREPGRFNVSEDEAQELSAKVQAFRSALQSARNSDRTRKTTAAKTLARAEAEEVLRRIINRVRTDTRVEASAKQALGIRAEPARPRRLACPQEPPRLRFVRALHQGTDTPRHELSFRAWDQSRTKPAGAVRLELFVDLILPDAPVPRSPMEAAMLGGFGGRAWYLRSYTKGPIVLVPPMAREAMRVVYWARWAGAAGDVGPFSEPAAGWIEGGSQRHLPGGIGMSGMWKLAGQDGPEPVKLIEHVRGSLALPLAPTESSCEGKGQGEQPEPSMWARRCVVSVVEAQLAMLEASGPMKVLGDGCGQEEIRGALPGAGAGAA